ncbi:MAG: hypothetical protein J1F36_05550 [Clostridiales bacterium]|nr:hypothetical protein [Clostridiales bacterium]
MNAWWSGLTALQQALFIIGFATTLFMIVQIVMIVVGGMGGQDDAFEPDGDVDSVDTLNDEGFGSLSGLKLVSLRTIIVFLAIGSWMAFAMCPVFPEGQWIAVLIGIGVGIGAAIAFAFVMRAFMKLQSSGNIDAANCKGLIAEVYLTIPAKRGAFGKIQVVVQERLTEFDAVTDCEHDIHTGMQVKVLDNITQGVLLVAPLDEK